MWLQCGGFVSSSSGGGEGMAVGRAVTVMDGGGSGSMLAVGEAVAVTVARAVNVS